MKPPHSRPHLGVSVLLFVCLLWGDAGVTGRVLLQKEETTTVKGGFLEDEIPLSVVSTIPDKLLLGGRIEVTGRQALTVVLSRPVLGLGQEINGEVPDKLKPFFLFPAVAGEYRWLTTYIVTFEPDEDWAPDLEVDFEWNGDLETFDGVAFFVRANSASQITTTALELRVVDVFSKSADNVTDGFWDAFVGTSFDSLPEVPMDAFVQLRASSPISLSVLQSQLLVVDSLTNGNPNVQVVVQECVVPEIPCPDCFPEEEVQTGGSSSQTSEFTEEVYYGGDYVVVEEEEPETTITATPSPETPVLSGPASDCVNISFTTEERQAFLAGRRYSLVLPAETQYSNEAGPLKNDIRISFAGLRDFRVPFVEDKNFNISHPRLQLWLPHGLVEDVNVTDFPMKIVRVGKSQDVEFTFERVSKSIVRIVGTFTPGSTYRASVFESPVFKDGFGQNLKRSSLNFFAAPIEHFFGIMRTATDIQYVIFEGGEDWGEKIPVFSKGSALSDKGTCKRGGSLVSVWDITKADSALPLLSTAPLDDPISDVLGVPTRTLSSPRKNLAGEVSEIDVSKLLRSSGLVAASFCRNDVYHPLIVCEAQVQVVVLITSAVTPKGRIALVWVTDMKTSKPLTDASVTIYKSSRKGNSFAPAGNGKTGKDGVGAISVDEASSEFHAVVIYKGKAIYVPYVEQHDSVVSAISDSIIFDKPIVRPGESLHIKGNLSTSPLLHWSQSVLAVGYVMQNDGGSFLPAKVKNVRLVVTPSMISRTKESDEIDVDKYIANFGSYTSSMKVPTSVIAVHHTISVKADVPGGESYVGAPEPFTVVDARQSPAVLRIKAPVWALPNKKIKIEADVTSFAGAPIQDAKLIFSWAIDDAARDEDDETLAGRVIASTNGKGEGSATIDLSKLKNSPSAGTVLEVTVHYTGSSGERVVRTTSVRLEPANADIILEPTVNTDVPLQEFGVRATVFDLNGKRLTSGSSLTFALKSFPSYRKDGRPTLRPTTSSKEAGGKPTSKCTKSLKSTEFCNFKLPKTGVYVLEACLKVGKGKVCKRLYLGKSEEDWTKAPLESHVPFGIIPTSSGPYAVGQSATFMVENPYGDVTLLLAWGSQDTVKTKTLTVKSGRSPVKFTVDSTCNNNCALSISAAIPRQPKSFTTSLKVPVNSVFDPAIPHTEHFSTVIETKRKGTSLSMKVSLPNIPIDQGMPLIEPGVNASVRVTFDRKGPVEITAFAIDTAILELLPYPVKDVSEDFISDLADYFRYKSTSDHMAAPGAIDAITKTNEARKKLDPWFDMISTVQPSNETSDIDLTDEQYLEQYVQYLTVVPRTPEEKAAALLELNTFPNAVEKEEEEESPVSVVTSDLQGVRPSYVNPSLFESFTASGGIWLVNFEGPKQGGVFSIRAYASTGDGLFGNAEVQVKVKNSISITDDFPVFARLGDKFDAGITVSIISKAKKPVVLTVKVSDNIKLAGPQKINLQMGNAREKEQRFTLSAVGIGAARIVISVDDGFGNAAKTQIGLTIYGPQPPVVISSSFPISQSSSDDEYDERAVPKALDGSGSLVVTAGHGFLPGLLLLADQVYTSDSFTCPVSADFVLATLAIPAIVDVYFPWSPDANLLPEFYVDLINDMIPLYQTAVTTVYHKSTSQTLGLEIESPCEAAGMSIPTGVSLEQNAKGLFVLNTVEKRLRTHSLEEIYKHISAPFSARKLWETVLEEGLVEAAAAAREQKGRISVSTVAIARLALGYRWAPPKGTSASVVSDLSIARLRKEFNSMSVEDQAYYVLTLLAAKKDQASVRSAFGVWASKITTVRHKAYMTTAKNSITAETALANSLVFLAMTRGKANGNILKGLAYYVTAPVSDTYGFTDYPIFGKTVAMLGLAEYDATIKRKKTNVRLEVRSGTIVLFSAAFTPGRHPVSAQSTVWKDLGKNPGPIQVFPEGAGEVNVALAMKYVPRDPLDNPVYKGIFVDRIIQLDSAGPISLSVSKVSLGTVVNINVQFMTPKDLEHTTVDIPLPAGLEPVQLGGDGTDYCPVPFFDLFGDEFYESCPIQIILADKVQFVFESVTAGSHAVSFKAVAAISGSYGVPPARVFVTRAPSTMGLTSATRLDICGEDEKCETETEEKTVAVKECKNSCSENGVCDLGNGQCRCFYGFNGNDCKKASV